MCLPDSVRELHCECLYFLCGWVFSLTVSNPLANLVVFHHSIPTNEFLKTFYSGLLVIIFPRCVNVKLIRLDVLCDFESDVHLDVMDTFWNEECVRESLGDSYSTLPLWKDCSFEIWCLPVVSDLCFDVEKVWQIAQNQFFLSLFEHFNVRDKR